MARKSRTAARMDPFAFDAPKWPTAMRMRMRDGRLVGVPGTGVWLYKRVPLSAVADAKTLRKQLAASDPLLAAFEAVAAMTSLRGGTRRAMVKSNYRETHLLMLNVPRFFDPPADHPCADQLREDYGHVAVENRVLLFGVRLRDQVLGKGGLRGAVDSVMETLRTGGTPLEDYDEDFAKVDAALTRAGLVSASAGDIRLANAWFNYGLASDPVMRPDVDSMTVFSRPATAGYVRENLAGVPVEQWPAMDGYHQLSMAAVQDVDLEYVPADQPAAMWGAQLLDAGAAAVSVRGLVEPARITRKEVEAQQKRYIEDIDERVRNNKLDKDEQRTMLVELESINALYGTGRAPATLVDTSIVAAFGQVVPDMEDVLGPGSPLRLNPMTNRQPAALAETWPCSTVRANPHRLDLPVSAVAYSGLVSLSRVGDRPRNGAALVGFTERDRQPAWLDPRAAYENEMAPLLLVAGNSGSGKTLMMLHLADQFARSGTTTIIIDPKQASDHSDAVRNTGGQVISLDDLLSADGVFDPLRFGMSPDTAVDLAASMLQQVNPWGTRQADYEVPANVAIAHGVDKGATCTGQALQIALDDGVAPKAMVEPVLSLARSNPQFRAMCGIDPASQALRVADGITYIRVGNANLSLPEPGATDLGLSQRISVNLVRLMVSGSAMALTGRNGVVQLDEAWVFLGAGNTELERLARLARSQTVSVMLFTQRVSDATVAGIDEHIAGGFILPLKRSEAKVACEILQLEPTEERLTRITAGATIGDNDLGDVQPNWDSMRALHRPGTREVIRGAVALYADINDRAVPVEVTISEAFLRKASTNHADIAAREAVKARDAAVARGLQAA